VCTDKSNRADAVRRKEKLLRTAHDSQTVIDDQEDYFNDAYTNPWIDEQR